MWLGPAAWLLRYTQRRGAASRSTPGKGAPTLVHVCHPPARPPTHPPPLPAACAGAAPAARRCWPAAAPTWRAAGRACFASTTCCCPASTTATPPPCAPSGWRAPKSCSLPCCLRRQGLRRLRRAPPPPRWRRWWEASWRVCRCKRWTRWRSAAAAARLWRCGAAPPGPRWVGGTAVERCRAGCCTAHPACPHRLASLPGCALMQMLVRESQPLPRAQAPASPAAQAPPAAQVLRPATAPPPADAGPAEPPAQPSGRGRRPAAAAPAARAGGRGSAGRAGVGDMKQAVGGGKGALEFKRRR